MRRTLSLSLIVAGAAVALAVGSYSVLANAGPVVNVGGVVVGADDPDDGDVVEQDDGDTDDENGNGVTGENNSDKEDGAQDVAQAIADSFGVSQEDVLALHEEGIGFGALFKLYVLAAAGGTTVAELQAAAEDEDGFAFGKLFKEMADEVSALSADGDGVPKNLGQVVSDAKKGDDGTSVAAVGGDENGGHSPPDHAKAHGRN